MINGYDKLDPEKVEAFGAACERMQSPDEPGADRYINAEAAALGSLVVAGAYPKVLPAMIEADFNPIRQFHKIVRATNRQLMDYSPDHLKRLFPHFSLAIDKSNLGRVMRDELVKRHGVEYTFPDDYDDPDVYLKALDVICTDRDLSAHFILDGRRTIQTNVGRRYVSVKYLAQKYASRWEQPNVLDVGTSLMHGPKKLMLNSQYPRQFCLDPIQAGVFRDEDGTFHPDATQTEQINRQLSRPQPFSEMYGLDIYPMSDLDVDAHVRACNRPSELGDASYMERYDFLNTSDAPGVHFMRADFALPHPACFDELDPDRNKFDIIMFCTVLDQQHLDEQLEMDSNAERYVSPDGIIIKQDFFDDLRNPHYPVTSVHTDIYSRRNKYYTLVKDMREPEKGYQPVIRWNGGRCEQAQFI